MNVGFEDDPRFMRLGRKLTPHQVQQIRLLLAEDKMYMTEIARQFGVSAVTIRSIKFGQIWAHLPWPEEKALPATESPERLPATASGEGAAAEPESLPAKQKSSEC